jgi:hypothetical protein
MQHLFAFASRFKGFLAFAAFILLILIFVFTYMFSKGSFNPILAGFDNLSPNQFLSIVYIALIFPFIIVLLLILLSFRSVSLETNARIESGLIYVVVHEKDDKTKIIPNAEVRLSLPEPRIGYTDNWGSVKFTFPAEFTGESYYINASKNGFSESNEQRTKMKHKSQIYIGLQRLTGPTERTPSDTNVGMEEAVHIFEQDYILPAECDVVIESLKSLKKTLDKSPNDGLRFHKIKKDLPELIGQITRFRSISRNETQETHDVQKEIYANLIRLNRDIASKR